MENMQSIRNDLEMRIMEKLKEPLTCKEIHDLACAYSELYKSEMLPMSMLYEPFCGCETNYKEWDGEPLA